MTSFVLDAAPAVFWAIPAYYLITMSAHVVGLTTASKKVDRKLLTNHNPRANAKVFQAKLSPRDLAAYERAVAAHANAHENMPLFIATLLGGTIAGLEKSTMTTVAVTGLAMRLAYTIVYLNSETKTTGYIRSLCWTGGLALNFGTLIAAGLAVSS